MTQRIESVLSGGGEMGERMRAVDQACKAVSAMQPEFASSHADLSRAQPSPRGGAASTRPDIRRSRAPVSARRLPETPSCLEEPIGFERRTGYGWTAAS